MSARSIHVLGVAIDAVTLEEACERAASLWELDGAHHIVTVNPELIMVSLRGEDSLQEALEEAALVVADGIGVVWASRIFGTPLPERVPGIELAERLLERAASAGKRVFLLGGRPGVADEAAQRLKKRFSGLHVVGTYHGYFNAESDAEDEGVRAVAGNDVDLLLVGMGAPRQETWIARRKGRLGAKLVMGVGGALDVFAGRVKRAPPAFQKVGLEWAYRLITQPRRAVRMTALPRFVATVLWSKWSEKG